MAAPQIIWANFDPQSAPRFTLADGVNCIPGTMLYVDGSGNAALADADAASSYAQMIAMQTVRENDEVNRASVAVCTQAILFDSDAPYTTLQQQYLSSTAGEFTGTRPTTITTSRLGQVVGFSLSTSLVRLDVKTPYEVHDYQQFTASLGEAAVVLDSGPFLGISDLNADNDDVGLTVRVPDNAVALVDAILYYAQEATAGGTRTFAIVVGSALNAVQHDAVTADSSVTALAMASGVADDIQASSIATAFDATNIIRPGALLGVAINSDLSAGTDSGAIFGIEFIWRCV
jgi:hypothetical protein